MDDKEIIIDEKMKLENLINDYITKIETILESFGEEVSEQYKEASFEDYALAKGSITYAKLSGAISKEEAKDLMDKLNKATKGIRPEDYIF